MREIGRLLKGLQLSWKDPCYHDGNKCWELQITFHSLLWRRAKKAHTRFHCEQWASVDKQTKQSCNRHNNGTTRRLHRVLEGSTKNDQRQCSTFPRFAITNKQGCNDEGGKQFGGEKRKLTSRHIAPFGRCLLHGAGFSCQWICNGARGWRDKGDPFLQREMNKASDRAKNNAHEMIIWTRVVFLMRSRFFIVF